MHDVSHDIYLETFIEYVSSYWMRLIFNCKNSHLDDDFIKENITTKVIDYSAKKNNQKSKHELSVIGYTRYQK